MTLTRSLRSATARYEFSQRLPGSGAVLLDDLRCGGAERSLFECAHAGVGVTDCDHTEDVVVSCVPPPEGQSRDLIRSNHVTELRENSSFVSYNGVNLRNIFHFMWTNCAQGQRIDVGCRCLL